MIYIFMLCLASAGCQADTIPKDYDLNGVLLFEEMLSNYTKGYFPDLVAFNPQTKERFVLTRETLFNVHPSWVAGGDSIIFESKRVRDHGAPSHLYVLNTRTSRITPLHDGMDLNRMTGSSIQYSRPAVNNSTYDVFFYGLNCNCLLSSKLNEKSIDMVGITVESATKILWSDDYKYLIVQNRSIRGLSRDIVITVYDTASYETVIVLKKDNWSYSPGDVYNGVLLYTSYELKEGSTVYLNTIDLGTGKKQTISKSDRSYQNWSFVSPVFKNKEKVFFIKEESNSTTEIWTVDVQSGEMNQITSDGKTKRGLSIYRNP